MSQALAQRDSAELMERAVIQGDLSALTPAERVNYYRQVCDSLGLNPFTKPFEYLALKDDKGDPKLVLYPKAGCTDQLRDIKQVSITKLETEHYEGLYIVRAYAVDGKGRTDSAIGAVPIVKERGEWRSTSNGKRYFEGDGTFAALSGDALANAIMKAETKAKRRVTLSLCGLGGMPEEGEYDAVPHQVVPVDLDAEDEPVEAPRAAWARVSAEASALGIEYRALPDDAPDSRVGRWVEALAAKVDIEKKAKRYDEIQADFVGPEPAPPFSAATATSGAASSATSVIERPTAAEKAAPRDPDTGEVLDDTPIPSPADARAALWTENRRLVAEAQARGIQGKTLNSRTGEDVLVAANEELAERIRNFDLDQQAAKESN